ncbi:MAG TPA: hypothetical protein VF465_08490, partial [Flavobacterium sp.]|uniref:hypothetical protein n=1 Tax=Flavobacterium sp. TaxID=239 RepID=UPI002ED04008
LTISNQIHVNNGGFLAFIVKGNITVDNSVGTNVVAQTTPAQVEGVYISDGTLTIAAGNPPGDLKFIGQGTFVGWGGVLLPRQYKVSNNNNSYPTDLFEFRPDLLYNIPVRMKRPLLLWQETN